MLTQLEAALREAGSSKDCLLAVTVLLKDLPVGRRPWAAAWNKWANPSALPAMTLVESYLGRCVRTGCIVGADWMREQTRAGADANASCATRTAPAPPATLRRSPLVSSPLPVSQSVVAPNCLLQG